MARRKRVLLDARKARDFGIGSYIRGLLGGLAGLDRFELHALVLPGEEGLLSRGVTARVCAATHYSFEELVAVRRAISAVSPDVFHAPHYVVPLFPPRATVVTVHDLMHLTRVEHAAPAKRLYARWMIGRALRLAAKVIAVSEATKKEILAFGPALGGKVVVIPNGVEERFFLESEERNGDARRLPAALSSIPPFKESSPYLLFLGNDKPHKNLDGLLRAFARLRASSPGLSLVLAGVAPGRIRADGVRALGLVPDEDVPTLLAGARALVLPSFAEGFGLPALEAQAAGTPVACADLPALRETAGDAAVFFDPHDVDSMVAGIERTLKDEELKRVLRKRGRKRAAQFTWARAAERTAGIYDSVLYPFEEKPASPEPGRDSAREGAKEPPS
jgi:glycosyltransferase involved in cell wall biosynthesis